jgi:hypothetical protein
MILITGFLTTLSAEMSITWTSPINHQNLPSCESIALAVDATADAGVKHVQFYANGRAKYRDRTAPYEFVCNEDDTPAQLTMCDYFLNIIPCRFINFTIN